MPRLTFFRKLFLVFLLFFTFSSLMQFRVKEIIGYDGYFHIKMAEIIRKEGFIKRFPYIQESILSDKYADIQLLFRILLIPFTYLGLMLGAKIASVVFTSLALTIFYWFLNKSKINYALFWTILYSVSSIEVLYRFLLPRAIPLAISLLVLLVYLLKKRKYYSILFLSLVFTWLYHGFILEYPLIIIYVAINYFVTKKFDINLILYPVIGTAIALIANPYFPTNIYLTYIQIFKVNILGNLYNQEWKPWSLLELITKNYLLFPLFVVSAITLLITLLKRKRISKELLFLFISSVLFLLLMIKSRRIQEYFAPFTVIFASFSLNDYAHKIKIRKGIKSIILVFLILLTSSTLIRLNTEIKNNHFLPWYYNGAEWLGNNIPANSTIFISPYTFTYLFFYNPQFRYTHGIDLTYSYLHDQEKFKKYIAVLQGKDPGYNIIKYDYNADYVFVGKIKQDLGLFKYILRYKKDFILLYEDNTVGILKVK